MPIELPDQRVIEEWLSYVKGKKVYILIPKQGDKEKLVELAGKNAGILMLRYVEKYRMEERDRLVFANPSWKVWGFPFLFAE